MSGSFVEWSVAPLGSLVTEQRIGTTVRGVGTGPSVPLLKMGNLLWGGLALDEIEKVSRDAVEFDQLRLVRGDILFNTRNTPELVGKTAVWPGGTDAIFDNNIMRIRLNHGVDPFFVGRWMAFGQGQRLIRSLASASTSVGAVYWRDLESLRVPLPPLFEQRRIAVVLDAWDDAIATTERLIDSERRRHRALVQRLIDERIAPKSELLAFARLVTAKVDPQTRNDRASIELEDIESRTGRVSGRTMLDITSGPRNAYEKDDVLFGKLRPYLAKFVYASEPGITSTEVWVLRADENKCRPRFLYFLVQSRHFLAAANKQSGSRMPRADWEIVSATPLPLPTLNEQDAIVQTLETSEAAISITATQADRLRFQKRGLMQKLLTGAWRVPASADALIPSGRLLGEAAE